MKRAQTPLAGTAIRDLHLEIEGTQLEPIVAAFDREVQRLMLPFRPQLYLSTEWGVPFGTIAIAIPFYLARNDLIDLHRERAGYLEGRTNAEIMRYLRHELGHVINYAYRLYDERDWVEHFGSITQPYLEEYQPEAFSRRYVHHLPGWYAQKHPDEDWAETFAVWMTPKRDWRADYRDWPAIEKLRYCDQTMRTIAQRTPVALVDTRDAPVSELDATIDEVLGPLLQESLPDGIEGALRTVFGDDEPTDRDRPASQLIQSLRDHLPLEVFRWTGQLPERTNARLAAMGTLSHQLALHFEPEDEERCKVALSALVTALAFGSPRRAGST
jgi:hypothetical protein